MQQDCQNITVNLSLSAQMAAVYLHGVSLQKKRKKEEKGVTDLTVCGLDIFLCKSKANVSTHQQICNVALFHSVSCVLSSSINLHNPGDSCPSLSLVLLKVSSF